MKKMLTIAVMLVFTEMASAASLNWSITNIKDMSSGSNATGYSVYLFITEQSKDFGATTISISDLESKIKSGSDISSYVAANKQTTNGMVTGNTGYYGNFDSGDSLKAFAVVFNANNYDSATHYIIANTEPVSASWTSATGGKQIAFGSMANKNWTPVPEPSTAVLALAGLALLLKRRRA